MHVALFGGSFNPPHVGHLLAAAYVRAVAGVDEVWLMPAHRHPFGKQLAPFEARVEMCRAMASLLTGVEVSEVEAEVPGEGRTLHTVEFLRARHPGWQFSLVVGTDILHEAHKWYRFDDLARLVRIVVLGRSGYTPPPRPAEGPLASATYLWEVALPEVSSTEVRARIASGRPVDHLVAGRVREVIEAQELYR